MKGMIGTKGRGRRAFTLVEILAVLVVVGFAGAGVALRLRERHSPEHEADRAMRWLYNIITKADRTGQSFTLRVGEGSSSCLLANWGVLHSTDRLDAQGGCVYKRLVAFLGGNKSIAGVTYSPQWGTFSSALTLEVANPGSGARHYLIISGQGRLRTSPTAN